MSEQQSTMDKCPTCGTTVIKFDPPLVFEAEEMCAELKIGTYTANGFPAPVCNLAKGHEGEHCALMEWTERWV